MVCKICNENDHIAKTCLGEYEGIHRVSYEKQECSICLMKTKKPMCKTKCGHFFHITCIKKWMKKSANCPLCRTQLREESNLIELILEEILSNIDFMPTSTELNTVISFYFQNENLI